MGCLKGRIKWLIAILLISGLVMLVGLKLNKSRSMDYYDSILSKAYVGISSRVEADDTNFL